MTTETRTFTFPTADVAFKFSAAARANGFEVSDFVQTEAGFQFNVTGEFHV